MEAAQELNTGCIYVIRNKINNKVYVGQTRAGLEARFNQHKAAALNGSFCRIHCAIRKHGIENFYIEELEEVGIDQLDEREAYWVGKLDAFEEGYNSTTTGQGPKMNVQTKRGSRERSPLMKERMKVYELERKNAILEKRLEVVESGKEMFNELLSQNCALLAEYDQKYRSERAYNQKLEGLLSSKLGNMTFSEFFKCKRALKKAQA